MARRRKTVTRAGRITRRLDGFSGQWAPIPYDLIRRHRELGLSTDQLVLLLAILTFKEDERLPWPSLTTLSRVMGVGERQLMRRFDQLEKAEFVRRIPRKNKTNQYDLSGLFRKLSALHPGTDPPELEAHAPATSDQEPTVPPSSHRTPHAHTLKKETAQHVRLLASFYVRNEGVSAPEIDDAMVEEALQVLAERHPQLAADPDSDLFQPAIASEVARRIIKARRNNDADADDSRDDAEEASKTS